MGPSNEDIWILDFGILDLTLNDGNVFGQWWINGFLGFRITNLFVFIYTFFGQFLKIETFSYFVINRMPRIKCIFLFT
jgi:hypothetical protein